MSSARARLAPSRGALFLLTLLAATFGGAPALANPSPEEEAGRFEEGLKAAVIAYAGGDPLAAAEVGDLFFEFETSGFRNRVAASDNDAYKAFEADWLELRRLMKGKASQATVEAKLATLLGFIARQRAGLEEPTSGAAAFWGGLLIILREGFEALLVIGALAAYLRRAGAQDRVKALYLGAGAAVVASLGLWGLARTLIDISGAQAELIEGVTMLVASAVLFYVSYWLVSKIAHARWDAFIRDTAARAVARGGGLAMASVSFLVVFREGFETTLFYEALIQSAGPSAGALPVAAGFGVGLVGLAFLFYGIRRLGLRLSFGAFFGGTSAMLYWLAFKFGGDGLVELQAAGVMDGSRVGWFPDSAFLKTWLGMHPFVAPLLLQGALILALVVGLIVTFRGRGGPAAGTEAEVAA